MARRVGKTVLPRLSQTEGAQKSVANGSHAVLRRTTGRTDGVVLRRRVSVYHDIPEGVSSCQMPCINQQTTTEMKTSPAIHDKRGKKVSTLLEGGYRW